MQKANFDWSFSRLAGIMRGKPNWFQSDAALPPLFTV